MAFFASPGKSYLVRKLNERNKREGKDKEGGKEEIRRMEKEERGHRKFYSSPCLPSLRL